jgi:hypothetical protein
MASNLTVLYDACILYPNYLRDVLIQLATTDLFRAKWTEQIHDEWIRNIIKIFLRTVLKEEWDAYEYE